MDLQAALLVFNVIHILIIFDFMRLMYDRKYKNPLIYVGGCILFYILDNFINAFHVMSLNIAGEFILLQVTSYVLFKPYDKKFFYNFLFYIYYVLLDLIVFSFFAAFNSFDFKRQIHENVFERFCMYFILFSLSYRYGVRILKAQLRKFIKNINLLLIFIMVWQIVTLTLLFGKSSLEFPFILLFFLSVFLCTGLCILSVFSYMEHTAEVQAKAKLYQQQAVWLKRNIDDMKEKNQEIRRLAHDLSSHLQVAAMLPFKEKQHYQEQLVQKAETLKQKVVSGHAILDSILENAIISAYAKNIVFKVNVEKLSWDFMNEIDMTSIFSNIINNAIEACTLLNAQKRCIDITILRKNFYIVVFCENTCDTNRIRKVDGKFITTKGSGHFGIGLENIKATIKKYDGDVRISLDGQRFEVKFAIPIPEEV